MTPFLQQVAAHYLAAQNIEGRCFIFPNRRSLVFFKKYLGDLLRASGEGPMLVPPLYTINDYEYFTIYIYDRRGRLIYESDDAKFEWDGRDMNGEKCVHGAYVYIIRYTNSFDVHKTNVKKGTVTLIR